MTRSSRRPLATALVISVLVLAGPGGLALAQTAQPAEATKLAELAGLAEKLKTQGKILEAARVAEGLLAAQEKALGPEHPRIPETLLTLAGLYQALGEPGKAEALLVRAVKILEKDPKRPAKLATAMNRLALLLHRQGRFNQAVPLYRAALNLRRKALSPADPDLAVSLNNLAGALQAIGYLAEAEKLYQEAVAIWEKSKGPESPEVAKALNNLALVHSDRGDLLAAERLFKRSLAISEKALGPDHPNVATSLDNLGGLYQARGEYIQAERLFRRAHSLREKALGPNHPDVATSLNNLAVLAQEKGDFAQAEQLYKQALALVEKALGPESPGLATALDNLGSHYRSRGDLAQAEALYKKALIVREKSLGPDHPAVAGSLNNLAGLLQARGELSEAEELYRRSLAIRQKALGPDHLEVAGSLNNLAVLQAALGDSAKALSLYKQALSIMEKALGWDHPSLGTTLDNLAALYQESGQPDLARPLYQRALEIREKAFGPDHPAVAQSLNNLAGLHKSKGDLAQARAALERSLSILEKAFGPEHPDAAMVLNNLAALDQAEGRYEQALGLYQKALAVWEKTLGPTHPNVATGLNNLAVLQAARGDHSAAREAFVKAQAIDEKLIDLVMGFTAEDQKIRFITAKSRELYSYLDLVAGRFRTDQKALSAALDLWLRRKGKVLEAQRRFQEGLVKGENPQSEAAFKRLSAVRTELSQLAFAGPGKEGLKAFQQRLAELEDRKQGIEAELSRLSQDFALRQKVDRAQVSQVAKNLPAGSVLVEVARVEAFDFQARGAASPWGPGRYLAFVVRPETDQGPGLALVDLGPAEEIERLVVSLKRNLIPKKSDRGPRKEPGAEARPLYDQVFVPLKEALGQARTIFFSPDGALSLIPLEILRDPSDRPLIEDYSFNYLTAGRDLLRFGQAEEASRRALLLGDPDYDAAPAGTRKDAAGGVFNFTPLPGTKAEVEAVAKVLAQAPDKWQVLVLTGAAAREEALQDLKEPPGLLHLATHGFFLRDLSREEVSAESGEVVRRVSIDDPLLRSGLALAGANLGAKGGKTDGILTAEKILSLRLKGTNLVVLSACETGLGETKASEGVFGLRRAFIQAGARSLVMSLWPVPDKETKDLMVGFYANLVAGGMKGNQALRQAALKLRQEVKLRFNQDNPFYWGAFVFLGQP